MTKERYIKTDFLTYLKFNFLRIFSSIISILIIIFMSFYIVFIFIKFQEIKDLIFLVIFFLLIFIIIPTISFITAKRKNIVEIKYYITEDEIGYELNGNKTSIAKKSVKNIRLNCFLIIIRSNIGKYIFPIHKNDKNEIKKILESEGYKIV